MPNVLAAQGQSVYDVAIRALASRRDLRAITDSLEKEIASRGVSDKRRRAMEMELEAHRQRLANGDMAPGDRILVRVFFDAPREDPPGARQDTVIVSPESTIRVAGLPPISMKGILRSEVESHLLAQVSAVIRNARVSAVPLVSIGILGAVTRPGYFYVPMTSSVTDAIMVAGGPTADADPNGLVYQRGGRQHWDRGTMAAVSQRQVTLASLGADDGDVLVINKNSPPLDRGFLFGSLGLVAQLFFVLSTR